MPDWKALWNSGGRIKINVREHTKSAGLGANVIRRQWTMGQWSVLRQMAALSNMSALSRLVLGRLAKASPPAWRDPTAQLAVAE